MKGFAFFLEKALLLLFLLLRLNLGLEEEVFEDDARTKGFEEMEFCPSRINLVFVRIGLLLKVALLVVVKGAAEDNRCEVLLDP